MTTILKRINRPTILASLLAIGLLVDLVLLGRAYDLSKSDWAGWVQAVGSIVAIGAGFAAVVHQTNSAARLAQRERLEVDDHRLTAALSVAMYTADLVDNVVLQTDHRASATGFLMESSHYLDFDGAARVLAEIPLYELRSTSVVSGVLKLQRCVAMLSRMTSDARADPTFDLSDFEEWRSAVASVRDEKNIAIDEIAHEVELSRGVLRALRA